MAPQSPDLSNFHSSPSKQSHQQLHYQTQPLVPQYSSRYQPHHDQPSSYAPRSPVIPSSFNEYNNNIDNTPYNHNQAQFPAYHSNPYESQIEVQNRERAYANNLSQFGTNDCLPPIPASTSLNSFDAHQQSPYLQEQQIFGSGRERNLGGEQTFPPLTTMASRNQRGRPSKMDSTQASSSADPSFTLTSDRKNPNPDNIEIKTKFPVARIKRIMQADEEVGKVAQVTPVAVNKALELFMIQLVTGAAAIAREKGGKRVTAQHLKQVVEGDQQFDFLQEIVAKVGDGQEGAGGEAKKRKGDSDSDEDVKPKKGRGRKKKVGHDE